MLLNSIRYMYSFIDIFVGIRWFHITVMKLHPILISNYKKCNWNVPGDIYEVAGKEYGATNKWDVSKWFYEVSPSYLLKPNVRQKE